MKIQFQLLVIFCFPAIILGNGVFFEDYVSHNDISALNTTCDYESCREERSYSDDGSSFNYPCSCSPECWHYSTCCIDSPFRRYTNPFLDCILVRQDNNYPIAHLLVSACPYDTASDSVWKDLCEGEKNEDGDILRLAPVTSLHTNVSYKNIYCHRCHEGSEKHLQWDLIMSGNKSDSDDRADLKDYSVSYGEAEKTWMALSDDGSVSIPVKLNFRLPGDFDVPRPKSCDPELIRKCNDSWTDNDQTYSWTDYVRDMCNAYTSYRFHTVIRQSKYKNPHCALCNYVPLDELRCTGSAFVGVKDIFSFYHLLRIDRDRGTESAPRDDRCEGNQLWDPYRKSCRPLVCAVPGYTVRNGRCSAP